MSCPVPFPVLHRGYRQDVNSEAGASLSDRPRRPVQGLRGVQTWLGDSGFLLLGTMGIPDGMASKGSVVCMVVARAHRRCTVYKRDLI